MRYFSSARGCGRKASLLSEYTENLGMALMRRKAMVALKAARLEAEMSLKARTEFVASMSHELRTPLNAIIGFSDLLKGKAADNGDQVREYAGYINDAARHLLELINQVLDISKIHAGRMELSMEHVWLPDVIEHCVLLISPRAKQKKIRLQQHVADDLPVLEADGTRLRQVLLNLLSNAVKFTPEKGEVSILARKLDSQEKNGEETVEIIVADTGEGMTQQEIARACEPFEQIHDQLNKKHEGTGLGLPISIAIVEMHGGSVHITSEKGKGTRVRVVLPVRSGHKAQRNGAAQHDADSDATERTERTA